MPLHAGRERQHLGLRHRGAGERAGHDETGHDGGGRRSQARPERYRVAHADRVSLGAAADVIEEAVHRAHHQVLIVQRQLVRSLALDHDLYGVASRLDLHFEVHAQGDAERVEAGADVGNGRRDANVDGRGHRAPFSPKVCTRLVPVRRPRMTRSPVHARARASLIAPTSAATVRVGGTDASAEAGSLSPCPVSTQATVEPGGIAPWAARERSPATEAALAGSTNSPSFARSRCVRAMSSSLTARIRPPEAVAASSAWAHEAGSPMRMALAIVCGSSTGSPRTRGAAPSACTP